MVSCSTFHQVVSEGRDLDLTASPFGFMICAMLDHASLPLQLYHKAKSLLWDPREIDLSQDQQDWTRLSERERALIADLSAYFIGGEEAVTYHLTPLLIAFQREAKLAEEMFLTTQLFEESKHVEWFDRWFAAFTNGEPPRVESAAYHMLFDQELPAVLGRLLNDSSAEAQVTAIATYHIVIEGVLAETGYHGYSRALRSNNLMPGTVRGVELVQRDEARHIAFGIYTLSRLCQAKPSLWDTLMTRLNHLLPLALAIVGDIFAPYGEDIPFGLNPADFIEYASAQFDHRLAALERALG
ncbi:MAG: R2-like ligand-binding oxidase [Anaerolineae bacterium]|nr:R2-like ligand-binding oxidase [Anaerolineae bacterium]